MSNRSSVLAVLALAGAVAGLLHAAQSPQQRDLLLDRVAGDLKSNLAPDSRRSALPPIAGAAAVTVDEVGDADSFGRAVKWLGVAQGDVYIAPDCAAFGTLPDAARCVQPSTTPGALTTFSFDGLDAIELPRGASESLLCHWFSPLLQVQYANPTAAAATAQLRYQPTLTIESPVLDDPALINALTGLPFNGSLRAGMSASETKNMPLRAGESYFEADRDTATCIAGFLTRRSLVESYGLTEAQARQVFRRKMTVRLNVSGSFRYVDQGTLVFGLRVTGD